MQRPGLLGMSFSIYVADPQSGTCRHTRAVVISYAPLFVERPGGLAHLLVQSST
ncbi:hypothetical protein PILCRDRAFT_821812 [Piloderma croceum F 1598]|uniref:Uncharacterized protein n=1 Tax=Piloderma croceum (strain F 1598) TaxID=765440 RepID=A0A0C3FMF4_PILCF|nr:hypothetical protein PILCRDRAFT_821812 [Piloderma croceum F 1598]